MWDWIRGGSIAAAGLLVGLAIGFGIWADRGGPEGFRRRYDDDERVRVRRVVDGDTIQLDGGLMVRYRGCDTPEVFRFVRDPTALAEEASSRNRELVEGAWVRLRFPPPGRPSVDVHGRLLADVYLDAGPPARQTGEAPARETVAETLVREGLAEVKSYEIEGARLERLRQAEAEARAAKRGLWSGEEHPTEAPFVASRYGKYIHRPECEYAKRINRKNLMRFNTLEAALSTGRGRCPTCMSGEEKREKIGGRGPRSELDGGAAQVTPSQ